MDESQFLSMFYFTRESFRILNEIDNTEFGYTEHFGIGEDGFIVEVLYPYAKLWSEVATSTYEIYNNDGNEAPGVFEYDLSDDRAPKKFIELCNPTEENGFLILSLPDQQDFKEAMAELVGRYMMGLPI